jgi:hypothetical protein
MGEFADMRLRPQAHDPLCLAPTLNNLQEPTRPTSQCPPLLRIVTMPVIDHAGHRVASNAGVVEELSSHYSVNAQCRHLRSNSPAKIMRGEFLDFEIVAVPQQGPRNCGVAGLGTKGASRRGSSQSCGCGFAISPAVIHCVMPL